MSHAHEPTRQGDAGAESGPPALPAPEQENYRHYLENFGDRAARLCRMMRSGRISSESCFRALTQLWLQVARARQHLAECGEEHTADKDTKA